MPYVAGIIRSQIMLFPEAIDDYITACTDFQLYFKYLLVTW